MAITFKETAYSGTTPKIWRGECKVLPAGFKPIQNFSVGTIIRRGTLVEVNVDDLTAYIAQSATALKGTTTTKIRVAKDLAFEVGNIIKDASLETDITGEHPTIKSIDKSNIGYDVIELSKAYTGLKENDNIVVLKSETEEFEPNGVICADIEVPREGMGILTLDVAYEGALLKKCLPFPVLDTWLVGGICLKNNPNIVVINQ